jgi:hypothetical protein
MGQKHEWILLGVSGAEDEPVESWARWEWCPRCGAINADRCEFWKMGLKKKYVNEAGGLVDGVVKMPPCRR